jgi:hypothetical protein
MKPCMKAAAAVTDFHSWGLLVAPGDRIRSGAGSEARASAHATQHRLCSPEAMTFWAQLGTAICKSFRRAKRANCNSRRSAQLQRRVCTDSSFSAPCEMGALGTSEAFMPTDRCLNLQTLRDRDCVSRYSFVHGPWLPTDSGPVCGERHWVFPPWQGRDWTVLQERPLSSADRLACARKLLDGYVA